VGLNIEKINRDKINILIAIYKDVYGAYGWHVPAYKFFLY